MDLNGIGTAVAADTTSKKRVHHHPDGDAAEGAPRVSPMAQEMNQLHSLQQGDPAKFKEVMAQIAEALKSLAEAQPENGDLAKMADQFQRAADTGKMPAIGGRGHDHHRPNAEPPPAANSAVATYAKADREAAWRSAEQAIATALSSVSP